MKDWLKIPFGVLCGLLASGVILLVSQPPRGAFLQLHPPPTAPPIIVHLDGAVKNPGILTLAPGARLKDALEAAGGLLPDADMQNINLAVTLQDGEKIWIPTLPPQSTSLTTPNVAQQPSPERVTKLVNINTASQEELETLPGIGPVLAQRIIAYRTEHGPFKTIEEILNVVGIGSKTFEKIKDLITV